MYFNNDYKVEVEREVGKYDDQSLNGYTGEFIMGQANALFLLLWRPNFPGKV